MAWNQEDGSKVSASVLFLVSFTLTLPQYIAFARGGAYKADVDVPFGNTAFMAMVNAATTGSPSLSNTAWVSACLLMIWAATSLPVGLALQVGVMAPAVAGQVGAMAPAVALVSMAPARAHSGALGRGKIRATKLQERPQQQDQRGLGLVSLCRWVRWPRLSQSPLWLRL